VLGAETTFARNSRDSTRRRFRCGRPWRGNCSSPQALSADPPLYKPWGSILPDATTKIAPGDDFYDYANGNYVKNLTIPARDRSRLSAISTSWPPLRRPGADDPEAGRGRSGCAREPGRLGAFYRAFMAEDRIYALGRAPAGPANWPRSAPPIRRRRSPCLMGRGAHRFFAACFEVRHRRRCEGPRSTMRSMSARRASACRSDYYLEPSFAAPRRTKYRLTSPRCSGSPAVRTPMRKLSDRRPRDRHRPGQLEPRQERDPTTNLYNPMTP